MKFFKFENSKTKNYSKISFLVILVALIINFFNLIDRDRAHSPGQDELTYFAYAYNIHHFNTFDYSLNKNSKPNSQKEPLYPWIISHVFKTIDNQFNDKNIECFTKVEQKCHQESFHYFIFVNFVLFLITILSSNLILYKLTKSYFACTILSIFLLTNIMTLDMVGHLYRENLITALLCVFSLTFFKIINEKKIQFNLIIFAGVLYGFLCLSHESFFLYSKLFIVLILLSFVFNKFKKIELVNSNLISLKKILLLFIISSIMISPYILRNVTLNGSPSIVSHGVENLVIRAEFISFKLKDALKVMKMNYGIRDSISAKDLKDLRHYDLETYDTVRFTYTDKAYIKTRLREKNLEINDKNQMNESLRVIFIDKLSNNLLTSLNIILKHSSNPKIELLNNYKKNKYKDSIVSYFNKINIVFDKLSLLFFFVVVIFFIIKRNSSFFYFVPILLYTLFFLFLVHYEQRYYWPLIPFTTIINSYIIFTLYDKSRKYFK
tara:strand:- start:1424 stop:2902 length:1479 start_codon:yes stop_codon:yes gene_type:complete